MRKILFFLLLVHQGWAQSAENSSQHVDSLSIYNRQLDPGEMKQDLQLFLDIRKKANSGLYRYRTQSQIDSIYKWAFKQVGQSMSTLAFYKIILQLTDFEGSCHNYTEPNADLVSYLNRQRGFFPFALKYIEGKMIFNSKTDLIPVGSRVLSINGVSDKKLMQSFYKYLTADGFTETEKLSGSVNRSYGLRYLYEYGIKDRFVIRFSSPGSTQSQTVTVPAVSLEERNANLLLRHSAPVDSVTDYRVQPTYSFKMVNPSTGLLNLRIFTMATGSDDPTFPIYVAFIDSVFQALANNNTPNLILDIRGNPGGSDPNFEQPMMYLTDSSFKENTLAYTIFDNGVPYEEYFWGISTAVKMDSTAKVYGKRMLKDYFPELHNGRNMQNVKYNPVYHPKSPGFKGKLYLLIDEEVASAGSHLASLVKAYARNVTIVGVETVGGYYGHNGHMTSIYELPHSKIKTKFSIVYVVQDAPVKPDQPEGRGIIPDYTVWPSFSDFMQNRDTQMEYVLKLIAEKH
ncbi:Peptidase family S41 [Chitinophaga sp. YR573]|uniref:S41 family peptidase n=1 Tax=Chitinophaga sp. YR573 TaxID=1881040 RepID=UPI0008BF586E|nr:S41 family peptidase [Chitinophaga sp. YR573]SEW29111.1 Peptidase family S41 [Chitinophaga sp. YR573]